MSHERMLRAEKELEQEINALLRKAEILDAQEALFGVDEVFSEGVVELATRVRHRAANEDAQELDRATEAREQALAELESRMDAVLLSTNSSSKTPSATGSN